MFLRRVNNALTNCSENYLVIPVFLFYIVKHILRISNHFTKN